MVDRNDDRLEGTALAAIDGFHCAAGWRRELNARIFHVREQNLAKFDLISHLNSQCRTQTHIVRPRQRNFTDRFCPVDLLFRRTGERKIKAFSNRKFLHS